MMLFIMVYYLYNAIYCEHFLSLEYVVLGTGSTTGWKGNLCDYRGYKKAFKARSHRCLCDKLCRASRGWKQQVWYRYCYIMLLILGSSMVVIFGHCISLLFGQCMIILMAVWQCYLLTVFIIILGYGTGAVGPSYSYSRA